MTWNRNGEGAQLLLEGWLTEQATADALGISVRLLRKKRQRDEIKAKTVAPGVTLYNLRSNQPVYTSSR